MEINDNQYRKEEIIMSSKISKTVAKGTVSLLNSVLRTEANSTACIIMHQPKAPKELAQFRKTK